MSSVAGVADTDESGFSTGEPAPASRRSELSAFLRSRRARLKPHDVGLPAGGRRRTPGLRREEVAQLAGVGVTWYTWLEQGRDIKVSAQVVDAIARTLRLDRHEWSHLSTLAGIAVSPALEQCAAMTPGQRDVLRQMEPYPAAVMNDRFDLLAYNDAYRAVMIDLDALPVDERNVLWLAFTSDEWRSCVGDLDEQCARLVASFRGAMANHLDEPAWQDLLARLQSRSPHFAQLWERHDVAPPGQRTKLVSSPRLGLLRLQSTSFWVTQQGAVRMVVYTPLDDATREALTAGADARRHRSL
ncbi:MAG TPA: helix-turn-helix transcriptional regulator [Nocardioidaceae bacterium]|nr:helix-turn-helix transcriptional regulator [Nocardioidaceae bacterium]